MIQTSKRTFLAFLCLLLIPSLVQAESPGPSRTVVIVHGAWGGGWDWKETAAALESEGFEVYRPTLTGLGERRHLLSPEIDLTTHIADIVNVLRFEQLHDVILVGHSYGGMVITGVAEALPERIARLVYFDAFLPFDGECALAVGREAGPDELCTPEAAARMLPAASAAGGVPPAWVAPGEPPPTDVPHPIGTFIDPIELAAKPGNGVPAGYIITRETAGGPDDFNVTAKRARDLGFPVVEYIGNHVPYREDPEGIARLFHDFSSSASQADDRRDPQAIDERVAVVEGLAGPEAVHWDAEQGVWFVSNFNGDADGDANGFVSRVSREGEIIAREFMTGTERHPLHGPRGMRIDGERLWVVDADGLHAFDRRSGEHLDFIDFTAHDPGFLNDIELGPDGRLYLTDTGNVRLFRITDGDISVVADEELVSPPNGIVWDPVRRALMLAPWGGGRTLIGYSPGEDALIDGETLPAGGNMDGLEPWQDGLLIASQQDQAIWFVRDGEARMLIRTPGRPADIGLDVSSGRIAVPYIALDRVDIWRLPETPPGGG